MAKFGYPWPKILNCTQFPSADSQLCIPESPLPPANPDAGERFPRQMLYTEFPRSILPSLVSGRRNSSPTTLTLTSKQRKFFFRDALFAVASPHATTSSSTLSDLCCYTLIDFIGLWIASDLQRLAVSRDRHSFGGIYTNQFAHGHDVTALIQCCRADIIRRVRNSDYRTPRAFTVFRDKQNRNSFIKYLAGASKLFFDGHGARLAAETEACVIPISASRGYAVERRVTAASLFTFSVLCFRAVPKTCTSCHQKKAHRSLRKKFCTFDFGKCQSVTQVTRASLVRILWTSLVAPQQKKLPGRVRATRLFSDAKPKQTRR